MVNIRRAAVQDVRVLSDIAYHSEAYWGYDPEYMENFRSLYRVTEKFIRHNRTYVLENQNRILGFYGLAAGGPVNSLEYFFIEPQNIGRGYGKLLWEHLLEFTCQSAGIKEFEIVTSPQAQAFYTRLGAVCLGEVESLLKKGRMIPRLVYGLPSKPYEVTLV